MIGCENVTDGVMTKADVATAKSTTLPPFPSISDNSVPPSAELNGSCYSSLNQATAFPSTSDKPLCDQVLVGANTETNRAQGVVVAKASPPSSLDALALACAAQDICTKEDVSLNVEPPSSSTPKDSNKSGRNDAADSGGEGGDGAGSSSLSFQLTNNDVLCGRGGLTNHHPGNVFFRRLVRMKQEDYLRASKRDKAGVARDIVDTIRKLDPPGRFLKKDASNPGLWVEIGNRKAREKTSQALREGAPEKREELSGHATDPTIATSSTTITHPDSAQLFTKTSITPSEIDQAARASVGCVQRARVVSSDSDGGTSGFSPFQEAYYPQGPAMSMNAHLVTNEQFCVSPTPLVTPTLTPSSTYTSSSSLEPMDASGGQGGELPAPPLFSGMKRKLDSSVCRVQDQQMQDAEAHQDTHQRSPGGSKRGPRLRIFKERMMELCN